MFAAGLKVLDGSQLNPADLSFPVSEDTITGGQVLELAESKASQSLYGFSLPENLKSSAFKRLNLGDIDSFRGTQLAADQAALLLKDYTAAIAIELRDDPFVVVILDGRTLRRFLYDEDEIEIARSIARSLYTDEDRRDKPKLSKNHIRDALVYMGYGLGVPSFSDFPMLNDIIRMHGAEGDEKMGEAQFAELLRRVLIDLAFALEANHPIVKLNIKMLNGSKVRKLLADENQLNDVIEKIYQETQEDKDKSCTDVIRFYLEKNGEELALPSPVSDSGPKVRLLYDHVFEEMGDRKKAMQLEKKEFGELVKATIKKFSERLEVTPIWVRCERR
ncbi:hypothetical protein Ancab_000916 [Ancistrocladus abbreviatus]